MAHAHTCTHTHTHTHVHIHNTHAHIHNTHNIHSTRRHIFTHTRTHAHTHTQLDNELGTSMSPHGPRASKTGHSCSMGCPTGTQRRCLGRSSAITVVWLPLHSRSCQPRSPSLHTTYSSIFWLTTLVILAHTLYAGCCFSLGSLLKRKIRNEWYLDLIVNVPLVHA